jgi:hypothetical protein
MLPPGRLWHSWQLQMTRCRASSRIASFLLQNIGTCDYTLIEGGTGVQKPPQESFLEAEADEAQNC